MKRSLPSNRESFFDNIWFKMTTLSPVHVGSGRKLFDKLDFKKKSDSTSILDLNKIFHELHQDNQLSAAISSGDLIGLLKQRSINEIECVQYELDGPCKSRVLLENMLDIKRRPIIPGSSIKGSLRTAVFYSLFDKSHHNINKNSGKKLNNIVMAPKARYASLAPNYDIGRIFRPSDAVFDIADLIVVNSYIANTATDNRGNVSMVWKASNGNTQNLDKSTPISLMAIVDSAESKPFRISIDSEMKNNINLGAFDLDHRKIQKICNKWTDNMIRIEEGFWSLYQDDYSSTILDFYKELREIMNENEKRSAGDKIAWIQRIGWGSGFQSITGGYQPKDFSLEVRDKFFQTRSVDFFPKTRRISDIDCLPMGWVLIEETKAP